jgi:hypothetical protein
MTFDPPGASGLRSRRRDGVDCNCPSLQGPSATGHASPHRRRRRPPIRDAADNGHDHRGGGRGRPRVRASNEHERRPGDLLPAATWSHRHAAPESPANHRPVARSCRWDEVGPASGRRHDDVLDQHIGASEDGGRDGLKEGGDGVVQSVRGGIVAAQRVPHGRADVHPDQPVEIGLLDHGPGRLVGDPHIDFRTDGAEDLRRPGPMTRRR